jgi:hypothetical protein
MFRFARVASAAAIVAGVTLAVGSTPIAVSANATDSGAIVGAGIIELPNFPSNGPEAGPSGVHPLVAAGAVVNGLVVTPVTSGAQVTINVDEYNEPDPPVQGESHGSFSVAGSTEYYKWTRIGPAAVILIGDSAYPSAAVGGFDGLGVGLLSPIADPGTDNDPPVLPVVGDLVGDLSNIVTAATTTSGKGPHIDVLVVTAIAWTP